MPRLFGVEAQWNAERFPASWEPLFVPIRSPRCSCTYCKIPLMTLVAAIDVPVLAWTIYMAMTTRAIGATGALAVEIVAGAYLSGFIAYWISRAIRKSQGINLDLVFKEIPPV